MTFVIHIEGEGISSSAPISVEMMRGGDNVKCEWKELESLSKDELIIELVKARWEMRNLMSVLGRLSETGSEGFLCASGSKPSEEWLGKIESKARKDAGSDEDFYSCTLQEYGVDEKTADECYDSLMEQRDEKESI